MNLTMVTDLCSIGTLFAFVLVCAGVLVLQNRPDVQRGKFRIPYLNSKFIVPLLFIGALAMAFTLYKTETLNFLLNKAKVNDPVTFITSLNNDELAIVKGDIKIAQSKVNLIEKNTDAEAYLNKLPEVQ